MMKLAASFLFFLLGSLSRCKKADYPWLAVLEISEQYDRGPSEADEIALDRAEAYEEYGSRLNP